MHTVKITITLRKGVTQETLWGFWQERPYPSIAAGGSVAYARWQNGFELPSVYGFAQLRPDYTAENSTGTRKDYAGFIPYGSDKAVPGAITWHGHYLGEITGRMDLRPHGAVDGFTVRGGFLPTAWERDYLEEEIAPALCAAIERNAPGLYNEAVADIIDTVKKAIAEARAVIDAAEKEAREEIAKLELSLAEADNSALPCGDIHMAAYHLLDACRDMLADLSDITRADGSDDSPAMIKARAAIAEAEACK